MPNNEYYNPGEERKKKNKSKRNAIQLTRVQRMFDNEEIVAVWKETGIDPKIIQSDGTIINQQLMHKTITGDELEILMDYYEQKYMFEINEAGKKYRVARPQVHFVAFLYKHGYLNTQNNNQFSDWERTGSEDIKCAVQYCKAIFENNNLSGGSKGQITARMSELALKRNDYRYKEQDVTINATNVDPIKLMSDNQLNKLLNTTQETVNTKIDYNDSIDVE